MSKKGIAMHIYDATAGATHVALGRRIPVDLQYESSNSVCSPVRRSNTMCEESLYMSTYCAFFATRQRLSKCKNQ